MARQVTRGQCHGGGETGPPKTCVSLTPAPPFSQCRTGGPGWRGGPPRSNGTLCSQRARLVEVQKEETRVASARPGGSSERAGGTAPGGRWWASHPPPAHPARARDAEEPGVARPPSGLPPFTLGHVSSGRVLPGAWVAKSEGGRGVDDGTSRASRRLLRTTARLRGGPLPQQAGVTEGGGGGGSVNGRPTTGVIAFPRVRLTWTRVVSLPRVRRPGADEGPPPTQRAHQLRRSTSSTLSYTSPTPRTEPTRAGAPAARVERRGKTCSWPCAHRRTLVIACAFAFFLLCESCILASCVSVGDLPTTASFVAPPFPAQRRPWCGCLPPLSALDLWPARLRCLR